MNHTQQEIIEDCQALSIFLRDSIDSYLRFGNEAGFPDHADRYADGLQIVSALLVEKLETARAAGKAR